MYISLICLVALDKHPHLISPQPCSRRYPFEANENNSDFIYQELPMGLLDVSFRGVVQLHGVTSAPWAMGRFGKRVVWGLPRL